MEPSENTAIVKRWMQYIGLLQQAIEDGDGEALDGAGEQGFEEVAEEAIRHGLTLREAALWPSSREIVAMIEECHRRQIEVPGWKLEPGERVERNVLMRSWCVATENSARQFDIHPDGAVDVVQGWGEREPMAILVRALRTAVAGGCSMKARETKRGLIVQGTDDELLRRVAELIEFDSDFAATSEFQALDTELALRGLPRPCEAIAYGSGHFMERYDLAREWRAWVCSTKHGVQGPLIGPWRVVVAPTSAQSDGMIACVPERVVVITDEDSGGAAAVVWLGLEALQELAGKVAQHGVDVKAALGVSQEEISQANAEQRTKAEALEIEHREEGEPDAEAPDFVAQLGRGGPRCPIVGCGRLLEPLAGVHCLEHAPRETAAAFERAVLAGVQIPGWIIDCNQGQWVARHESGSQWIVRTGELPKGEDWLTSTYGRRPVVMELPPPPLADLLTALAAATPAV